MPHRPRPHPYLDAPHPIAFAHRGGGAQGDENSSAALARAAEAGYRYIETDVHVSTDGVPVLFHDPTLKRLTGDPRRVEDLAWPDLAAIRLSGEPLIPRLDDVLGAWPHIRFNIDIKTDTAVESTLAALNATNSLDRVCIGAFSDARLARVRKAAGPRLATSMGPKEVARFKLASLMPRSRRGGVAGAVALQVPVRSGPIRVVDRRFVAHAHDLGLDVHVWTVDDAPTINALLDLGVDGVMTDRLDVLKEVYTARGLWPDPTPMDGMPA
ncbi:glycerophosphoryl diester phosphodiesterase [Actinorhabdospora filicis]|uniref:Glycerophosphoryl diester phosphodiesterase n=1 Tax=Actinorhabdospora filicis TaxID=1785913 RepID=A0A9W6W443_9ACTN|nr:glycerophosphodiester phosphodiesterase family protein [Actinorhabdospora filicis]GLZ78862.1 glycerophosphoryl diester phosphodiesterase [Actinorhabdospora filicis]